MTDYFSGPSTAQMRLTMLLIGAAALVAAIFSATHIIEASAVAPHGNLVTTQCGSAYAPQPASSFFPDLAASCAAAIGMWPFAATALFAVAAVVLVRFLYMMIGPKTQAA
ncbi:hypothetical protein [Arthrobacter sp. UYCo732]|uniref:hypothetical protein n=1 Tax=Arthrobacter sp. UYCo732 TaxID=3156336 RepID=UPI003395ABB2